MDRVTRDEVDASDYITYIYDDAGNLTERREVHGTASTTTDYGYDAMNRRTSETFPGYSNNYTYTLDSQLATITDPGGTTSYDYDALDRVSHQLCWKLVGTSSNGCGSAPSGATTYSYDADGNQLTGGSGGSFAYDDWNRLVTIGSTDLSYASPTSGELASYGTTSYTNDVLGLSSQTTGSDTTSYVRDPSGAPIAQRRSSSGSAIDTDYLLSDALGSTIGLVNGTSTSPVKTYTYDPDGNATASTGGPTTDLKFAGGHALSAGLYHFGARYYDPSTGRWTQPDPLNQPSSLTEANRYVYAGGDPINALDPRGTSIFGDAWDDFKGAVRQTASEVGGCIETGLLAEEILPTVPGSGLAGCAVGAFAGGYTDLNLAEPSQSGQG